MSEPVSPKLKADDYLRDFAANADGAWLSSLIKRVLDSHKVPDTAFLNRTYNEFLASNGLSGAKTERPPADATETPPRIAALVRSGFTLKSLVHERGVNALVNGATISLHPQLTVIYGQNGTGKSGFVRILKKVGGSRTQEDVWQNVHEAQTRNQCSAKIVYESAGKENTVLVKRDPLQVRIGMAERVRELAQQEFFLSAQDAADPGCILSPTV